ASSLFVASRASVSSRSGSDCDNSSADCQSASNSEFTLEPLPDRKCRSAIASYARRRYSPSPQFPVRVQRLRGDNSWQVQTQRPPPPAEGGELGRLWAT